MQFVDNELDNLVDRLQERTLDWLIYYDNWNTILGNIGEKFVGYCVCHGLWKLGYELDLTNRPYSYNIIPKYRADPDGYRGIDYYLTIVDSKEHKHHYMIEVKNWNQRYSISTYTFREQILSRFTRADENHRFHWILVINTQNIELIRRHCNNFNITTLGLPYQLAINNVFNPDNIEYLFSDFIDRLCFIITVSAPEDAYPYLKVETRDDRPKWSMIFQDILMGVPNNVIRMRYKTTDAYISRCANELRQWIPTLPDRRRKDWRTAWEVQD